MTETVAAPTDRALQRAIEQQTQTQTLMYQMEVTDHGSGTRMAARMQGTESQVREHLAQSMEHMQAKGFQVSAGYSIVGSLS